MKAQQGTRLLVGLDEEKSLRLQPGFFDRDVVLGVGLTRVVRHLFVIIIIIIIILIKIQFIKEMLCCCGEESARGGTSPALDQQVR